MKILIGLFVVLLSASAIADNFKAAQKAIRTRNFDQAFQLYIAEARAGNVEAQYQTGKMYLSGIGGEKNRAKAAYWFDKASEAGHAAAQYNLGVILEETDAARAKKLFERSAAQNYSAASRRLNQKESTPVSELPAKERLFIAAKKNDVKQLKQLGKDGVKLNRVDSNKRTALYFAVEFKAYDAQVWLLKQGLSPISKDKFGLTPLAKSIEIGDYKAFAKLLANSKGKIPALPNGDSILHQAIRKDYFRIVKKLVSGQVDINSENKDGWTALDLASHMEQEETVKLLESKNAQTGSGWLKDDMSHVDSVVKRLDANSATGHITPLEEVLINNKYELFYKIVLGYEVALLDQPQKSGNTIVGLAVKQKKLKFLKALVAKGASVDVMDARGETPLIIAVKAGDFDMVKYLLSYGADVLIEDHKNRDAIEHAIIEGYDYIATALLDHLNDTFQEYPVADYLLLAVKSEQNSVVKKLTYKQYKLNKFDDHNRNALWYAVKKGSDEIIPNLIKAGVAVDSLDDLGQSHLIVAVKSGCLACAKELKEQIDLNHQTDDGSTALMVAAEMENADAVKWLIENKAEIETRNNLGNTALIYAVQANSKQVVQLLLDADANVTRKNKFGLSALDIAKKSSPSIHKLLKDSTLLGIF